jgi:predicted dehydrogenase
MRFGLVGTGHWARVTHAVALSREPAVDFAGVWGRDPVRAAELAEEFGVRSYPEYESMLEDVEAVAFSVPPDVQADLAVRAARAGRHLLLEKPIATSPSAARHLEAAVEEAGVASVVFFTTRFFESHREWLADAARTGGWRGGWALWIASAFAPGSPYGASAWRREKGALWDVGPHALSILSPALGSVVGVTADAGAGDLVHLVLHHQGGATSTVSMTLGAPPEAGHVEVTLWGASGLSTMPPGSTSPEDALCVALQELVECAATGECSHPCDVHFGRHVVELLAQAEHSIAGSPTAHESA